MQTNLVLLEDVHVKIGATKLLDNINLSIQRLQHTAIIGSAAAGKTILAQTLLGNHFFTGKKDSLSAAHISLVTQQHLFSDYTNTRSQLYYQQRFQSFDESTTSTVADYLQLDVQQLNRFEQFWMHLLNLKPLLAKNLIHLSNGENKRVQLYQALQKKPRLIILDQPFIGLDPDTRATVSKALSHLSEENITYLLLTSSTDLPESIQQVYVLANRTLSEPISIQEFKQNPSTFFQPCVKKWNRDLLIFERKKDIPQEFIRLKQVDVKYKDQYLLKDINLTVLPNTAWCIYGGNGAGKSTLLSLITADHPQAYSNEVYLFGKKRGTGESIWEVKKNIGFLSPELHLYFDTSATCFETIASGLFDTIGLFKKLSDEQNSLVQRWLNILHLEHLAEKRLQACSTGEQRQILIARACIKQPLLLVLDEPCQGLDDVQTQSINDLIDLIFENSDMSLLYVTHYHHQIPKCIHQFFRMEKGIGSIHT